MKTSTDRPQTPVATIERATDPPPPMRPDPSFAVDALCPYRTLISLGSGIISPSGAADVELGPCEVLVVSSGSLWVDGRNVCGGDGAQICIVTWAATSAGGWAHVEGDPGNTWSAVGSGPPDAIVTVLEPDFWAEPNCGDGCAWATVVPVTAGTVGVPYEIRP